MGKQFLLEHLHRGRPAMMPVPKGDRQGRAPSEWSADASVETSVGEVAIEGPSTSCRGSDAGHGIRGILQRRPPARLAACGDGAFLHLSCLALSLSSGPDHVSPLPSLRPSLTCSASPSQRKPQSVLIPAPSSALAL